MSNSAEMQFINHVLLKYEKQTVGAQVDGRTNDLIIICRLAKAQLVGNVERKIENQNVFNFFYVLIPSSLFFV